MFLSLYKKFVLRRKNKKKFKAIVDDFVDSYANIMSEVYTLSVEGNKTDLVTTGSFNIYLPRVKPFDIFERSLEGQYILIKSKKQKNRIYIAHVFENESSHRMTFNGSHKIRYQRSSVLGHIRLLSRSDMKVSIYMDSQKTNDRIKIRRLPNINTIVGIVDNNEVTAMDHDVSYYKIMDRIKKIKVERNTLINGITNE